MKAEMSLGTSRERTVQFTGPIDAELLAGILRQFGEYARTHKMKAEVVDPQPGMSFAIRLGDAKAAERGAK